MVTNNLKSSTFIFTISNVHVTGQLFVCVFHIGFVVLFKAYFVLISVANIFFFVNRLNILDEQELKTVFVFPSCFVLLLTYLLVPSFVCSKRKITNHHLDQLKKNIVIKRRLTVLLLISKFITLVYQNMASSLTVPTYTNSNFK